MTAAEMASRLKAKRAGSGWVAKCPAHDDRRESLSIGVGDDGRVLLHCFTGCTADMIAEAAGVRLAELFADKQADDEVTYDYRDERGELLFQVVRRPGKKFVQRRPDGKGGWTYKLGDVRRVPYRLPGLCAADPQQFVFVPEGEKDCDNLLARGLVATTNMGGAEAWSKVAVEARKALAGRCVIVLPDNDEPGRKHAADIEASLGDVAKVHVLALPGLPVKGDVSDWLAAGGTAEQLCELAYDLTRAGDKASAFDFAPATERLAGEAEERRSLVARELAFNVSFLDDVFGGILPNDLVLVGARTGAGKTQLASLISETNAAAGRAVNYFALEAENREIERRIKYRMLVDLYFRFRGTGYGVEHHERRLSYRDWYRGRLDDLLTPYEPEAERLLAERCRGLRTYYRGALFTLEHIERTFNSIGEAGSDLIVLDHLHYVDVDDDDGENRGYKRVVMRIRDLCLRMGVPVILIAHLRKRDRHQNALLPDLDDFHGTSDIVKIATKVVLLDRVRAAKATAQGTWGTYMTAAKYRMDASVTGYAALLNFDARRSGYRDAYALGRAVGEKFVAIKDDEGNPPWAVHAIQPEPALRKNEPPPGYRDRYTEDD